MSASSGKWSKYQALAWEQLVVSASVCGVALCIGLAIAGSMWGAYALSLVSEEDARGAAGPGAVLTSLFIAMIASIARQNAQGELSLDFDPRLRRMPVRTLPLVALVFATRGGCMLLFAGLGALQWRLIGSELEPAGIYGLLCAYLVLQTIVWTRQSLTGIEYLVGSGVLLTGLATMQRLRVLGLQLEDTGVSLLLLTAALAFGVSLLGIALTRRDARWPLPKPGELFDALAGFRGAPNRPFRNPLAAQIWFERQRAGWLLPVVWLLLTIVLIAIYLPLNGGVDPDREHHHNSEYWLYPWLPYFALLAASAISGAVALSVGAGPTFGRPLETRHLALAKLIGLMQSLALTAPCAFAASVALSYQAEWGAWDVMLTAWSEGETDIFGLAAWHLGTALLMVGAAWILMFFRAPEIIAIIVGSLALIFGTLYIGDFFSSDPGTSIVLLLLAPAFPLAAMLLTAMVQFWRGLRAAKLSFGAVQFAAAIAAAGAAFAFLYVGSVQFDATFLWVGLAAGAALALPGATVTLHLARLRHR